MGTKTVIGVKSINQGTAMITGNSTNYGKGVGFLQSVLREPASTDSLMLDFSPPTLCKYKFLFVLSTRLKQFVRSMLGKALDELVVVALEPHWRTTDQS